jgi:Transposase IS116/IS110/IS902 family
VIGADGGKPAVFCCYEAGYDGRSDRHTRLERVVGADGCALPPQVQRELERELARLELVMAQIAEVEAARDAVVTTTARPEDEKSRLMIANLTRLRGIGPEIATVLVREIFYRCFGNRRQVASYAGLTPSPYASGGTSRDQGISKAGNALVRTTMIELAWLWPRPTRQRTQPMVPRASRQDGRTNPEDHDRGGRTQAPGRVVAIRERRSGADRCGHSPSLPTGTGRRLTHHGQAERPVPTDPG